MRALLLAICLVVATVSAQSPSSEGPPPLVPPPPSLSELNRLKLQNVVHRMEIAQLRSQVAERDFQTAKSEYDELMKALAIEGYTLDLQSLTYQKVIGKLKDK
jgi:hypothetical protein